MNTFDVSTTKNQLGRAPIGLLKFFALCVLSSSCIGSAMIDDGDPDDGGTDAGILDGAADDGSGGRAAIVGILSPISEHGAMSDGGGDGDGVDLVDGGAPAPPAMCECDGEPLPEVDGDGAELPHCNADSTAMVEAAHACGQDGECIPATLETPCGGECVPRNDFLGQSPRCR